MVSVIVDAAYLGGITEAGTAEMGGLTFNVGSSDIIDLSERGNQKQLHCKYLTSYPLHRRARGQGEFVIGSALVRPGECYHCRLGMLPPHVSRGGCGHAGDRE